MTRHPYIPHRSRGHSLLFAVAMSTLLLLTSLAYLKWQVAAQLNARRQIAITQAYYVAQAAVIQVPLGYMRNARPTDLSAYSITTFNDGIIEGMGRYYRPMVKATQRFSTLHSTTLSNFATEFVLTATGAVEYNDFLGHKHEVRRKARLIIQRQFFSNYFYLTDIEQTRFGDFIYFWERDTLRGRVHSNSQIAMIGGNFYDVVSSTAQSFMGNPGNAIFRKGFRLNTSRIDFPYRAEYLRSAAAGSGAWLMGNNHSDRTFGLYFHGTSADGWSWQTGTPSTYRRGASDFNLSWNPAVDYPIFCDGTLWISGYVAGRVAIGAKNSIRLMDNMVYEDCQSPPYMPDTTRFFSMMTILSEAAEPTGDSTQPETGILVADVPANGRGNGAQWSPSQQGQRDIAVCAQIIALNASFTFEDQNIPGTVPTNYAPDERGNIYIRGALAQRRRGIVHHYYNFGTGYNKGYLYDERFKYVPPPFVMDATASGRISWRLCSWQFVPRHRNDEWNE